MHTSQTGDEMTIEGYGSVYDVVDTDNDIIEKGAFTKSLTSRIPKMLFQHDMRAVIGVWNVVKEDAKGLFLKGKFSNTTGGRDAFELTKDKAIDGLSVGFMTNKDGVNYDKSGVRRIKEAMLYEVSLVTFPANEDALITSVKTEFPESIRDFEKQLRFAGFNDRQCKLIASKSWAALDSCRDGNDESSPNCRDGNSELSQYVSGLTNIINQIKKGN